jgi:transcriptional regulator with AAA-type ATPase domain
VIHIYHLDDEVVMFKRCVEPACVELKSLFGIDAEAHLVSPSAGDQFLFFDAAGNRITNRQRLPIGLGANNLYDVSQLQPILHDPHALILLDINFGSDALSIYGVQLAKYLCAHGVNKERILLFSNYLENIALYKDRNWSQEIYAKKDFSPMTGAESLAYRLRGKCVEAGFSVAVALPEIPSDLDLVRSPEAGDLYNRAVTDAILYAPSKLSVLITGESGVGKFPIAKLVHKLSPRREKQFVSLNSAQPEELLESEMFGHVAGAFTGANKKREGKFTIADGGTLFLDEVGDMPMGVQVKLLTALDSGEFYPLGGDIPIRRDVRIVSATNKEIVGLVDSGHFRFDLYQRLAGTTIYIPPLRDRQSHIPLLAKYFIEKNCTGKTIIVDSMTLLKSYQWPGNVRELENCIRRACILSGTSRAITPEHLTVQYEGRQVLLESVISKYPAPIQNASLQASIAAAPKMEVVDVRDDWVKLSTRLATKFDKHSFLPVIARLVEQYKDVESRRTLTHLILIAIRFACDRPAEARGRRYEHANALLKLLGLIGHFTLTGQLTRADEERLVELSGASDRQIPRWSSFAKNVGQPIEESWNKDSIARLLDIIKSEIDGRQI